MIIYEHTYKVIHETNKKVIENIEKKIEDILNKSSGKIHKTEIIWIKKSSIPNQKNNRGYYRNLYLEGNKESIKEIENFEKFDDKPRFSTFRIYKT